MSAHAVVTREDFEALIWRTLGRYARQPLADDVAAILRAADAYSATEGGVMATRRRALEPAHSPACPACHRALAPRRRTCPYCLAELPGAA